jgi:hypothetical protein
MCWPLGIFPFCLPIELCISTCSDYLQNKEEIESDTYQNFGSAAGPMLEMQTRWSTASGHATVIMDVPA